MKINIHSDNIKVTEAIKKYICEKLGKLDKYFEDTNNISARVVIKVRERNQTIEITIPTNRFTLRNEETNNDLYAAIDLIVDKLERQIRKNKTKLQSRIKEHNDFKLDYLIDIKEEEDSRKIVKRKRLEMKPMDEEEAILEMDMLGHDFFIFKDTKTDNICVLYKRKDGHYGIIETK